MLHPYYVLQTDGSARLVWLSTDTFDRIIRRYAGAHWLVSRNRSSKLVEARPVSNDVLRRGRRRNFFTILETGEDISLHDVYNEHLVIVERGMYDALVTNDSETIATTKLAKTIINSDPAIFFAIISIMTEKGRHIELVELCMHLWITGASAQAYHYFQGYVCSGLRNLASIECTFQDYVYIAYLAHFICDMVLDEFPHDERNQIIEAWKDFEITLSNYDKLQTMFAGLTRLGISLPASSFEITRALL